MINRTPLKIDGSKQLVYKVIFTYIQLSSLIGIN